MCGECYQLLGKTFEAIEAFETIKRDMETLVTY